MTDAVPSIEQKCLALPCHPRMQTDVRHCSLDMCTTDESSQTKNKYLHDVDVVPYIRLAAADSLDHSAQICDVDRAAMLRYVVKYVSKGESCFR